MNHQSPLNNPLQSIILRAIHDIMAEAAKSGKGPYIQGNMKTYVEACGVRHLDRWWAMKGSHEHERAALFRSHDLHGAPSYVVDSSNQFMEEVNLYTQEILLPKVLATLPQEYEQTYRPTFQHAALGPDELRRPGFHTGHVIVQKQQIHQHMDGRDSGFCVAFCTGSFEGGYLVFPDLNIVLFYRPGDVILFRSRALYHGVTMWVPKGDVSDLGITPGRTAHVLYTKNAAVRMASANKFKPGYVYKTANAKQPAIRPVDSDKIVEDFPVGKSGIFRNLRKYAFKRKKIIATIDVPEHTKKYLAKITLT